MLRLKLNIVIYVPELGLRMIQSISCNVLLLSVFLSVCLVIPSWKPCFPVDWILLVKERIAKSWLTKCVGKGATIRTY